MLERKLTARAGQRLTIVVLSLAVASFGVLQSLIIPVIAKIQVEFDTDQSTVTWVLTSYLLSAAVATPLIGRIGDVVGKQRMLVVTLVMLAAGSVLAAVAPTIGWLIVARTVQGLGGGVLPLAFGIIRDEIPPERAGQAVGIVASLISGAFGLGVVVSGPIVDLLGFRWLFWTPAILTMIAAVGAVFFIPASPVRTAGRISVLPAVLLSGWLVALLLALSEGNDRGWASAEILGLLAGTVLMFTAWIVAEKTAAVPLIDIKLMRLRGVWTANVVALVTGFGTFASLGFLPQLLQTPESTGYGFGATISESGHVLLPSAFAGFFMGFVAPRLVRRFTARKVVCVGGAIVAVAFALIAMLHEEIWQLSVWMGLQGVGSGLIMSSLAAVVLGSVPPRQSGVASGMNANIRLIGGLFGTAMMAGVITRRSDSAGLPLEAGYMQGYVVLASVTVIAAVVALLIPRVLSHQVESEIESCQEPAVDLIRAQV